MIYYVHYNNHKAYSKCPMETSIQEDGVWKPAVLYYSPSEPNKYYVRSVEEFNEKFIEVNIPVEPITTQGGIRG